MVCLGPRLTLETLAASQGEEVVHLLSLFRPGMPRSAGGALSEGSLCHTDFLQHSLGLVKEGPAVPVATLGTKATASSGPLHQGQL